MIKIPKNAEYIIDVLKSAGYHASIVGGSVRDALLGRIPDDFDITTDALPDAIRELFPRTHDTGIKHGTVTVVIDKTPYEVTTYRIDGEYRDGRHPESVSFTDKIELDLSRRDFTVNAMAYNRYDGLIDLFGGRADLEAGIIRAVGEPELRFTEDALRIFRAIRFSSVLDFDIEKRTAEALRSLADGLRQVSRERILVEWRKLLGGVGAYGVIEEYFDVITLAVPGLDSHKLPKKDAFLSLSATDRELLLYAVNGGAEGFTLAAKELKMDNKTRVKGISVLSNLLNSEAPSDAYLKEYLIGKGEEESLCAARISEALGTVPSGTEQRLATLIADGTPRSLSMLAIGGRELADIGFVGGEIGNALSRLLRAAALGECANERGTLLEMAKRLK